MQTAVPLKRTRLGPSAAAVENWRDLFTDADAWRPLVAEILRRHGMSLSSCSRAAVPGSNAVTLVNDDLVVKVFWPRFDDYEAELQVHCLLASCPAILAPRIHAHGSVEDELTWRYMVFERLPGLSLSQVRERVPHDDMLSIATTLAEWVRLLHGLTPPDTGPLRADLEGWRGFIDGQIRTAMERHAEDLRSMPHLLAELPDYIAAAEPMVPHGFRPSVLHCDLTADHLLVEEVDGHWRLTGLIDFGDAATGHIDYEWIALHLDAFDCDTALTQRFLCAYGYEPDDAFAHRMTAYCFLHRFGVMGAAISRLAGARAIGSLRELEQRLFGTVVAP